ncbi:MAG: hypothetical protein ACTHW2_12860 [Tissierella sp.]|uniref:hypothetical protein n=1 Tax=Tissierella sp. TaxID=41274 RepID=UPI003F95EB6C
MNTQKGIDLLNQELKSLSKETRRNTEKELDQLNQGVGNLNSNLKKSINRIFSEMDSTVNKLKNNIQHTEFKDKAANAFPIAVLASIFTLFLNWLFNYFF